MKNKKLIIIFLVVLLVLFLVTAITIIGTKTNDVKEISNVENR